LITLGRHFPIRREGFPFIVASVAGVVFCGMGSAPWLSVCFGVMTLFIVYFFRDPERSLPAWANEGSSTEWIVSPGDGKIVDILSVSEARLLQKPAIRISIFLNIFDVHVNRSPVAGKVLHVVYNPGRFFSAHVPKASLENEQNAILLETPKGRRVVCVQIAGLIARRIVCWVSGGTTLKEGERLGMIRFGSRVDLYLPEHTDLQVSVGDRVRGGETILGRLP